MPRIPKKEIHSLISILNECIYVGSKKAQFARLHDVYRDIGGLLDNEGYLLHRKL